MLHQTEGLNQKIKHSVFIIIIFSLLFQIQLLSPLHAESKLTLLLTSNLQGRFSLDKDKQDDNDPLLVLGQSLIKEKNHFDFYLDLGNAFYPGTLSRYSYGSVMMDFFNYFNCEATLISSRDISIGLSNLEFLSKGKKTKMLSANITKDLQPVFTPYIIIKHSGKKIGIIGISSADGLFDIADKQILNISFREYRESIKGKALKLKKEGCDNLILLSGLSYRNNIELLQEIPEINLIISGGDSTGSLFSVPSSRIDLQWGRSIVTLLQYDGYYKLELDLGEKINIASMNFIKSLKYKTTDPAYTEFSKRLSIWKKKFKEEENYIVAENIPATAVVDETVANMLRHRYRCEIGILEKYSIHPQAITGTLYYSKIMSFVNNDYPIFTYRLSGADLNKIIEKNDELVITGIDNGKIQNYPLSDEQTYSICSTQFAYDKIKKILRKHIEYKNSWKTLQDEIVEDLKTEKSLTSENFDFLDDRFRVLVSMSLSNFYDRSIVTTGEDIGTPPGKPEETYRSWGMEDTLDITIYNRYHQLIFTPYVYFIKNNEKYEQNLLRGTLLYTYNPNSIIRPYHKSQLDTSLVKVVNAEKSDSTDEVKERTILLRETAGASLNTETATARFGAGFEKQIQNPENTKVFGIEILLKINYPITEEVTYSLNLDSFTSFKNNSSRSHGLKNRTEFTNALSFKLNSLLSVSMKNKWFILDSKELGESYKYSQNLISIDLNTDFKLF